MGRPNGEHSHDTPEWVDVAVWAAIAVTVVLGVEWLMGRMARESIAAGASKYLRAQPAAAGDAQP